MLIDNEEVVTFSVVATGLKVFGGGSQVEVDGKLLSGGHDFDGEYLEGIKLFFGQLEEHAFLVKTMKA